MGGKRGGNVGKIQKNFTMRKSKKNVTVDGSGRVER